MFKGVQLKGKTPSMVYTAELLNRTCDALKSRFKLNGEERDIVVATKVLSMKHWPVSNVEKMQGC